MIKKVIKPNLLGSYKKNKQIGIKTSFLIKHLNYLEYLLGDKKFKEDINQIRKKCNILEKDFSIYKENTILQEERYRENLIKNTDIKKETEELLCKYGLSSIWLLDFINHIAFGKDFTKTESLYHSMFKVLDFDSFNYFLKSDKPEAVNATKKLLEIYTKGNSIGIFINPYACENDIINFIRAFYRKKIEPLQKLHRVDGVRMGKIRKKNDRVIAVKDFIFKNKDMRPISKLLDEFERKFGYKIDSKYMFKIRREEIRKRSGTR